MAESSNPASSNPATAPTGGPATPPKVLPWLLAYTLGRLVIAAALIGLLWAVGLGAALLSAMTAFPRGGVWTRRSGSPELLSAMTAFPLC